MVNILKIKPTTSLCNNIISPKNVFLYCLDVSLPAITHFVNLSTSLSKHALVVPLFKNSKLDSTCFTITSQFAASIFSLRLSSAQTSLVF